MMAENSFIQFMDFRFDVSPDSMSQSSSIPVSSNNLSSLNQETSKFDYLLKSLESQCPEEDKTFFQTLNSLQTSIINQGFSEESSIHNSGAIKFYSKILSANSTVLETLSEGYLPGKLNT